MAPLAKAEQIRSMWPRDSTSGHVANRKADIMLQRHAQERLPWNYCQQPQTENKRTNKQTKRSKYNRENL